MKRRSFCQALSILPTAVTLPASAQSARMFRVAWVSTEQMNAPSPNFAAFREGMRELRYVEGRDVTIDAWWGEGSGERVIELSGPIVASQPDVIVAAGGLALFSLLRAGVKAPIVFSISADPVEAKVAESFAHPGGNATGISLLTLAIVGKRMQILKEALPGIKRVAVLANSQHPGEQKEREASQAAASQLGLALHYFPVRSEAELEAALKDIAAARDEAILAFADGFTLGFAGRIAKASLQYRIPTIDGWAPFARAGNLMTYGPVLEDVHRRLAVYVDKIHKGAKPADLPVELPTKVELVINVKTAKALGITIPQALLLRADEVIQ
ncbi:MAG: ABC transporter substrate-binding protein [Casimicrobiaceae bacterium]